jgi:hypothetical protein
LLLFNLRIFSPSDNCDNLRVRGRDMEKRATFSLRYSGATPDGLEARELIRVLSAFTQISNKASQTYYGAEAKASFRIAHVQPGSIDIEGLFELVGALQPGFALLPTLSLEIKDIPTLIKRWLDILKFLQGKPPQRMQKVDNGNAVQIENANGDVKVVNGNVYNSCVFLNVGRDAAKLDAPMKHGASKLELVKGTRKIATYSARELGQLGPIRPNDRAIESEIEAIAEVVSPVLDGEGIWRFKYGNMRLKAKLTDEKYREKVASGEESFRHGDRLRVRLKTVQENVGDRISTKHFVTKVIERA